MSARSDNRASSDRPSVADVCLLLRAHAESRWLSKQLTPVLQEIEELRVELDARNEKMNAKIRDLTLQKVPYVLVMGDKEAEAGAVSVRVRGKGDQGSVKLQEFVAKTAKLAEEKSTEL